MWVLMQEPPRGFLDIPVGWAEQCGKEDQESGNFYSTVHNLSHCDQCSYKRHYHAYFGESCHANLSAGSHGWNCWYGGIILGAEVSVHGFAVLWLHPARKMCLSGKVPAVFEVLVCCGCRQFMA